MAKTDLEKFADILTRIGCAFVLANGGIEVTRGYVYLPSLAALPEGVTFNNGGYVDLPSLTSLPDNAAFNNGGYVYLPSLTSLPDNAAFNNGGSVDLNSLAALPEGVTFNNGGYVDLPSLTSLPDNAAFNNGGYVYLPSLPDGKYTYQGQTIRLKNVDGSTMLVRSTRAMGEYQVMSCRYFGGGDLDKLKACYVARHGDYFAHGETVEKAIRDCRFKVMQADFDVDELVETIRERGTIEFNDFRLLTGACESGLRHGLQEAGLDPDTDVLPLAAALKAAHGPYGETFRRMFEEVAA